MFASDEMLSDMDGSLRPILAYLSAHATMKHGVVSLHRGSKATPLHGKIFAAKLVPLFVQQPRLTADSHGWMFRVGEMHMM